MKKSILVLAFITLGIVSHDSLAQFTLTGEITPRAEFRNGFKRPILNEQDPAFFVEQRSRLYMNYKSEKFEVQFNLQDVRFWGGDGQIYKNSSALTAVHRAWGKYNFNDNSAIKVGRQALSYDNQRFFGGLEWAMQGRQHDAFLYLYEKEGFKLHIGGAFNQNPVDGAEPARLVNTNYTSPGLSPYHATGNYKHMQFLWLNKKFESGTMASLYLVNDARQDMSSDGSPAVDSVNARQTYGLMLGIPINDNFKLDGEFFYQGGKVANDTELGAMMFSLAATYKTDATPITLGIDYLSGNDETTSKNEAFAPAFGTNHAFYGYMDYFYVGNGHLGGLQDIFLKTKFNFAGGSLLGHIHYFMSATDVTNQEGTTADKGLGTEIDLVYVKKLAPEVTWKLGYSQLFDTDAMKAVKAMPTAADTGLNNWVWSQIIFKPVFFKSDK